LKFQNLDLFLSPWLKVACSVGPFTNSLSQSLVHWFWEWLFRMDPAEFVRPWLRKETNNASQKLCYRKNIRQWQDSMNPVPWCWIYSFGILYVSTEVCFMACCEYVTVYLE
jgi:hypothetical protein